MLQCKQACSDMVIDFTYHSQSHFVFVNIVGAVAHKKQPRRAIIIERPCSFDAGAKLPSSRVDRAGRNTTLNIPGDKLESSPVWRECKVIERIRRSGNWIAVAERARGDIQHVVD